MKRIESLDELDTTNKYKTIIHSINALIEQYNTTIAKRKAAGKNDKPADGKGDDKKG